LEKFAAYKRFETCDSVRWLFKTWDHKKFESILTKNQFNQAFAESADKLLEEFITQIKKQNRIEDRDICINYQYVAAMIMITSNHNNDFYELVKNMESRHRDILEHVASCADGWLSQVKRSTLERMKKELDEAEVLAQKEFQDNMDILESSLAQKKETQESSMANQ
jgi:hypothetical protein